MIYILFIYTRNIDIHNINIRGVFLLLEDLLKEYKYKMQIKNFSIRSIKTSYNSTLKKEINIYINKSCIRDKMYDTAFLVYKV